MANQEGTDNSKWGRRGCGIMILIAFAVPMYLLGGPLLFAGILVLGGFGYFLWLHQASRSNADAGEGERDVPE